MPSFFKSSSSKNQTASAAATPITTPAQTPRNSIHEHRVHQGVKMTHDEALLFVLNKTMSNAAAGPYIR
ncbi:hypothetical protein BGX30_002559 [Mortierella sp. GBA39]|nr:hypothetical protein BGX30_002559 [Mortierella sp. GBA39]